MGKDNKVVTYKSPKHGSTMAGATQAQVEALRKAGALEAVRRVRRK